MVRWYKKYKRQNSSTCHTFWSNIRQRVAIVPKVDTWGKRHAKTDPLLQNPLYRSLSCNVLIQINVSLTHYRLMGYAWMESDAMDPSVQGDEKKVEVIAMGEITKRFAIMNCDWTRLRVVVIFAQWQAEENREIIICTNEATGIVVICTGNRICKWSDNLSIRFWCPENCTIPLCELFLLKVWYEIRRKKRPTVHRNQPVHLRK